MRFLIYAVVALAIALSSLAALAQPRIPDPTQEQVDSARGFAQYRERAVFTSALFSLGVIPKNCTLGLADVTLPATRFNYVLECDGPMTWCDVPGANCE